MDEDKGEKEKTRRGGKRKARHQITFPWQMDGSYPQRGTREFYPMTLQSRRHQLQHLLKSLPRHRGQRSWTVSLDTRNSV